MHVKFSSQNLKGRNNFKKLRYGWEANTKLDLREREGRHRLDLSGSEEIPVITICEHCNRHTVLKTLYDCSLLPAL
jgi:hypothetical protein